MARISLEHWTESLEHGLPDRLEEYACQHWALVRAAELGDGPELRRLLDLHFNTLEHHYGIH